MKKLGLVISLVFVFSFLPSLSSAYQYNFLQDSPVAYYTDQDWKLYKAAARDALDNKKDGAKVSWNNPTNNHGGYFIASNTKQKNGRTCRILKIFNYGKHRTDESTYELCKYPEGWRIPGD